MVKRVTLETGHTLEEWNDKYGDSENRWDFPIEELLDGTIEPDEDMVYWVIDNRVYETI